jgi:hypothetical protein
MGGAREWEALENGRRSGDWEALETVGAGEWKAMQQPTSFKYD